MKTPTAHAELNQTAGSVPQRLALADLARQMANPGTDAQIEPIDALEALVFQLDAALATMVLASGTTSPAARKRALEVAGQARVAVVRSRPAAAGGAA